MKKNFGFTMVEMILVMTLLGLFATAGGIIFAPALDSWAIGSRRIDATQGSSGALYRMANEIFQLRDDVSIVNAGSNLFQFVDVDDNDITYSVSGGLLMRNGDVLARNVTSLSFSYWDINDDSILPENVVLSPTTTNVWRLSISLTTYSGDQAVTLQSQVHPRNLPRPGGA